MGEGESERRAPTQSQVDAGLPRDPALRPPGQPPRHHKRPHRGHRPGPQSRSRPQQRAALAGRTQEHARDGQEGRSPSKWDIVLQATVTSTRNALCRAHGAVEVGEQGWELGRAASGKVVDQTSRTYVKEELNKR